MRTQAGTTSLRALLYMDEIFGYFPPVANPPSKMPLLTLLKQARAFGVGIVLEDAVDDLVGRPARGRYRRPLSHSAYAMRRPPGG